MTPQNNQHYLRWVIIISSFAIISLILWDTYTFFNKFKNDERSRVKLWSAAQSDFLNSLNDLDSDVNPLTYLILTDSTSTTPMIMLGPKGLVNSIKNIDTLNKSNPKKYLKTLQKRFETENIPIEVKFKNKFYGTIYYGNSIVLNKLKYSPLSFILVIVLFTAVVYFFYKSSKNAAQNKLWSGMAKETAHQIGTPLSSLIGWTEILKMENVNPDYIVEIEKDIERLQTITDRFSKIGSIPVLTSHDIVATTKKTFNYLEKRSSRLVTFTEYVPDTPLITNLNPQLYSWTIENLVKNSIDAMKGKGQVDLKITHSHNEVFISISDTGKGIPKQKFKTIFEPGYTTKKRGWGLGLSLTKRIVEDFHKGKIAVLSSEIDKGTTIQMSFKLYT